MEEKRRDVAVAGGGGGGDSPASAEPTSSTRRRPGGQKRKSGSLGSSLGSLSSPTPSKRISREKSSLLSLSHHALLPIHNHNGPLTRARQVPASLASASSAPPPLSPASKPPKTPSGEAAAEMLRKRNELEALEATIEAKFESVRSRSEIAHVVPNHCGWFSWTKIHPIEERTMLTFFDGKSELRTPDTYLEIRNWIMRKFHVNPGSQIEPQDLSELDVADSEARQEVMEFLDYWGLINFHPFPKTGSAMDTANGDNGAMEKVSLADKLYHFETPQSSKHAIPKNDVTAQTVPSGLFPESAFAEEFMKLEGPSVEYHCNSCSADCSRKRYHCQKQADFDLCSECYSNKKFDSGMSSSDFILMEPGEVPGLSGGKWTDQETLLLLEALELYKENWSEIAEHVATKTKAQCILHFVQMPIEDGFYDVNGGIESSSKETAIPVLTEKDSSTPKDTAQTTEGETDAKENQAPISPVETSKEEKSSQDTSKPADTNEAKASQETSKLGDENESKDFEESGENSAMTALKQAFEAVGYPLSPEGPLSFLEVGNPVMALAAFLANFVGADLATASAHNSLKSLSANSPGIDLATRHCFILEDPPNDTKELTEPQSNIEAADGETQKESTTEEEISQKEDSPHDNCNKKSQDATTLEEKKSSPDTESPEKSIAEETEPASLDKSETTEIIGDTKSKSELTLSPAKETEEKLEEPTTDVKDSEMSEAAPADASQPVDEASDSLAPKDEKQKSEIVDSVQEKPSETAKDVEMVPQSEKNDPSQPVSVNAEVESTAIEVDTKECDKEKHDSSEIKEEDKIDRLKRSAVSAISAAAVKAKLLATQEEDQIRQLSTFLIEKQLQKLEYKLTFFSEMESVVMRVREQLDRSRQRLYQERANIIAARLAMNASTSRMMPSSSPANRIGLNVVPGQGPRPSLNMGSLRPPMPRPPMGTMAPNASIPLAPNPGSVIRPPGQEKLSSVGTK